VVVVDVTVMPLAEIGSGALSVMLVLRVLPMRLVLLG